jgi:hypothetical protein
VLPPAWSDWTMRAVLTPRGPHSCYVTQGRAVANAKKDGVLAH